MVSIESVLLLSKTNSSTFNSDGIPFPLFLGLYHFFLKSLLLYTGYLLAVPKHNVSCIL